MILLHNTLPTSNSGLRGGIIGFDNPHLILLPFMCPENFLNICELLASTVLSVKEFQC